MKGKLIVLFGLIVILMGCATSGEGVKRGSSYEIIQEEILNCDANNAYEIIQRLRPNLLLKATSARGGDMYSQGGAAVYLDNVKVGGLSYLKQLNSAQVASIEYLRASEATMRFGANHGAGAFMVKTR